MKVTKEGVVLVLFVLACVAVLVVVTVDAVDPDVVSWKAVEKSTAKAPRIRMVGLCTPNYRDVGGPGIEALEAYCKKNGYEWRLHEKKLLGDKLHVNFNKMQLMAEELKNDDVDYTILSDVDVDVKDDSIRMEPLIQMMGDKVVGMPSDSNDCLRLSDKYYASLTKNVSRVPFLKKLRWIHPNIAGSTANAGLIVAKNGPEAVQIMQDWVDAALGECSDEAQIHPRNQNVFDKCVYPKHKDKIEILPYQYHGLPCSMGIQHGFQWRTRKKLGLSSDFKK